MIHTTTQSAKFTKLVRRIRTSLPGAPVDPATIAVGLLERLWHFAITSAKRGDIGQHDDELIAEACGWIGEPQDLIAMLVETGWLDECEDHRLVVHDWQDHAPAFIKRNIDRVGGFICAGKQALPCSDEQLSGRFLAQNDVQAATPNQTKPNLTKPNLTKPNTGRPVAVPPVVVDEEVYEGYRDRLVAIHKAVDGKRGLRREDRHTAILAAVLARERLGEDWLDEILGSAKLRRGELKNPWAYFKKACISSVVRRGENWDELCRAVRIDEQLLNGRQPVPAGVQEAECTS